jgi:hypothetical protein
MTFAAATLAASTTSAANGLAISSPCLPRATASSASWRGALASVRPAPQAPPETPSWQPGAMKSP